MGGLEIIESNSKFLSKTLQIGFLSSLRTLTLTLPNKGYKSKNLKQEPTILTHGNIRNLKLISSVGINDNYGDLTS